MTVMTIEGEQAMKERDVKHTAYPFTVRYAPLGRLMASAAVGLRDPGLMPEHEDALLLLTSWADMVGTRRASLLKLGTKEFRQPCDDIEPLRRAFYVEGSAWFDQTRGLLVHLHVRGLPISAYRVWEQGTGIGVRDRLLRHGMEQDWAGRSMALCALACYGRFCDSLLDQMVGRPYRSLPITPTAELSGFGDHQVFVCGACAKEHGAHLKRSGSVSRQEGRCSFCAQQHIVSPRESYDWPRAAMR